MLADHLAAKGDFSGAIGSCPMLRPVLRRCVAALRDVAWSGVAQEGRTSVRGVLLLFLFLHLLPFLFFVTVSDFFECHPSPPLSSTSSSPRDARVAFAEFLLFAKKKESAFQLAVQHGQMPVYASVLVGSGLSGAAGGDHGGVGGGVGLLEQGTAEDYLQIARYFESAQTPAQHRDLGQSGVFYDKAGRFADAVRLFLQCGESRVEDAIEVVRKSVALGRPGAEELVKLVQVRVRSKKKKKIGAAIFQAYFMRFDSPFAYKSCLLFI